MQTQGVAQSSYIGKRSAPISWHWWLTKWLHESAGQTVLRLGALEFFHDGAAIWQCDSKAIKGIGSLHRIPSGITAALKISSSPSSLEHAGGGYWAELSQQETVEQDGKSSYNRPSTQVWLGEGSEVEFQDQRQLQDSRQLVPTSWQNIDQALIPSFLN